MVAEMKLHRGCKAGDAKPPELVNERNGTSGMTIHTERARCGRRRQPSVMARLDPSQSPWHERCFIGFDVRVIRHRHMLAA